MFVLPRKKDPLTLLLTSFAKGASEDFIQQKQHQRENEAVSKAFSNINEDTSPLDVLTTISGLNVSPERKSLLLKGFEGMETKKKEAKKKSEEEQQARKTAEQLGMNPEEVKGMTSKQIADVYKAKKTGSTQGTNTEEKKKQADAVAKRLGFNPEEVEGLDAKQIVDLYKAEKSGTKPSITERPIDEDQLAKIEAVRSQPGFEDLDEIQQYQAFTRAGVSRANAEAEAKLKGVQLERRSKALESSYKSQKDFIDDTTSTYRGFETEMKPRLLQMQSMDPEKLISPTAAVFLDALGIPLGALEDPSSELYNKLSQDLLKGLPETYGSRILKVEVENFLRTIPQLVNSPDGRRMIASNMLKLGEMKEVYYNEMRRQQKDSLDNSRPIPPDFQQRVFDQVKPQIDRINNEFVKLSEITSVPKDHIPFFNPNGDIEFVPKEHAQWAQNNGGRRIW